MIVDNHRRENLALEVSQRIRGLDVVTVLERITRTLGFPKRIQVDNGPELLSKDVDRRAIPESRATRLQSTKKTNGQCDC